MEIIQTIVDFINNARVHNVTEVRGEYRITGPMIPFVGANISLEGTNLKIGPFSFDLTDPESMHKIECMFNTPGMSLRRLFDTVAKTLSSDLSALNNEEKPKAYHL